MSVFCENLEYALLDAGLESDEYSTYEEYLDSDDGD